MTGWRGAAEVLLHQLELRGADDEHPLSIHRPDSRLRSPSFATVRVFAFSASRRGKSDGGERQRPCHQGHIRPRTQPPPHFLRQDANSEATSGRVRARGPLRASTGASTARVTCRVYHNYLPQAGWRSSPGAAAGCVRVHGGPQHGCQLLPASPIVLRLKEFANQDNDTFVHAIRWGDKPYRWDRL